MGSKGRAGAKVSREIARQLRLQGWRVVLRNAQYQAFPPDRSRGVVTFSETPGENRSVRNTLSHLRQAGADTTHMPKG